MEALLGRQLQGKNGRKVSTSSALGQADCIGIYFSAHWCPPCRGFTPRLAAIYEKLKSSGKKFEVVFVSSDREQSGFDEYYGEMPWLALPFSDRDRNSQLSSQFGVSGIPTLVLMDKDGTVITDNGTSAVLSQPDGGFIPPEKNTNELIIYGRDGCGMCSHFKSQLESEGIDYRMVSCDDAAGNTEMWAKCAASNITGSVGLPVVDVYGETSIRPSIADVKARMSLMGKPLPKKAKPAAKPAAPSRGGGGGGGMSMQEQMDADVARIQEEMKGSGKSLAGVAVSSVTRGNVCTTETTFTFSDGSTRVETKTVTRG